MGSVPVNKITDYYQLTCGICSETYKNPKVLPCLHSFCQNCLDSNIRYESSTCIFLKVILRNLSFGSHTLLEKMRGKWKLKTSLKSFWPLALIALSKPSLPVLRCIKLNCVMSKRPSKHFPFTYVKYPAVLSQKVHNLTEKLVIFIWL